MHIILTVAGVLWVWACYRVLGPRGFVKLVLTMFLVLALTAVGMIAVYIYYYSHEPWAMTPAAWSEITAFSG